MLDPVYKRAVELEKRLEFLEALCGKYITTPMVLWHRDHPERCRFCAAVAPGNEENPDHDADCPVSKYAKYKRENTQDG